MKGDLTPVYVLHARPFRNTSLLVDLFSEQYGRISVVARSARGPKSRYQGQLQLFTPMLAAWIGRHELKTLTQIELQGMPFQLNQQRLFCAFYVNELLARVLQKEDPYPQLFSHYQTALHQLSSENSVEIALRLFEKRLLEALGYGLPLTRESKTGFSIQPDAYYTFDSRHGFVVTHEKEAVNRHVFYGADLLAIGAEELHLDSVLAQAKRLLRLALQPLVGERPLHSRSLFML